MYEREREKERGTHTHTHTRREREREREREGERERVRGRHEKGDYNDANQLDMMMSRVWIDDEKGSCCA